MLTLSIDNVTTSNFTTTGQALYKIMQGKMSVIFLLFNKISSRR